MAEQPGATRDTAMPGAPVLPSFANSLPYFLSLGVFPFMAIAAVQGSWWIAAPYLYFMIPDVFDAMSGADEGNMDPRRTVDRQLSWYKLSCWAWGILWPVTFVFCLWQMFLSGHLALFEIILMAFVLTTVGQVSFIVGHELIHRRAVWERRLGEVILASVSYPTYASEHIFVHHSLVGTPGDPGSAPRGVSFWRYLPREIRSNFTGAWAFERQRLTRRRLPVWHYTNPFWRYVGVTAAWYVLMYWMGGPWAVLGYVILCTCIIMSMKLINYVQHYGLRRIRLPNGRYERVQPWHSWSAAYKLSNWFFFNMQRHPDHHIAPGRRYPLLQHCGPDAAPQLPGTYVEMAGLAVRPRRWFEKMDPRVDRWRKHFYPDIDDWSAYDSPATAERPDAFEEIEEIFASAPRLAAWIDRSPELLDNLRSREFTDLDLPKGFGPTAEVESIARRGLTRLYWTRELDVAEMRARIDDFPVQDVRETVDAARNWSNDKAFQIGMHTLRGNLTPIEAGTALSNIAEASVGAVLGSIEEDFGHLGATGGLAAVVLGDAASGEAAPGLELRMLLVHEGGPAAHYEALCPRIRDALHALTQDSLLFAPAQRDKNPVTAVSLTDFRAEIGAGFGGPGAPSMPGDLTRANCIFTFGDAMIETRFEAARLEALAGEGSGAGSIGETDDGFSEPVGSGSEPDGSARDPDGCANGHEGNAIESAETASSPLEPERGGFEAVERAARQLRLRLADGDDGLGAPDARSTFRTAGERGLIAHDAAERLAQAATLWRNLQGIRRLVADGSLDIELAKPGVKAAIARSCGFEAFDALTTAVHGTANQAAADIAAL